MKTLLSKFSCYALLLVLAAYSVGATVVKAEEGDPPEKTQEQIAAEKQQHDTIVERARVAASETAEAIAETVAKITALESQPTPAQVGSSLNRPAQPVRGPNQTFEEYQAELDAWNVAVQNWYNALSDEDRARWNKAVADADDLRRKRSQLERWEEAKRLHDTRVTRKESARTAHCTAYPLSDD